MNPQMKRTWAEIHLNRLDANYRAIRAQMPQGCKYMALVKANAYGHGAVPCAKRFQALGADYFAVACLDEAIELRQAGLTLPILILGYTPTAFTHELLTYDVTQTVYDAQMAEEFSRLAQQEGGRLRCHMKADTGMSRLGFLCDEEHLEASAATIARLCALPGLEPEGLFMHFAVADSDAAEHVAYSQRQIARFETLRTLLRAQGVTFRLYHCDASAAIMNYAQSDFDMVRPGIIQYGHHPDASTAARMQLQPVMELKSRVASVKTLPAGTTISYGRTYTLPRDSRVAAVPIGYADGLFRLLSNRQRMLVNGMAAPQIGRVCMDMCMLDVTDLPEVHIGDVVTCFGDGLPLEEKADEIGTITYELLCAVAPRVPRVYLEE